jgi:hypothetical protein
VTARTAAALVASAWSLAGAAAGPTEPARAEVSDLCGASRMEDDFTPAADLPRLTRAPDLDGLPDPLVMLDGARVTSPAMWERRRVEMKRIIAFYCFGRMPPPPGNVVGKMTASREVLDGRVRYRAVHLTYGPDSSLSLDIAIFTPAGAMGPFPIIVNPSFDPTPTSAGADGGTVAAAAQGYDRNGVFSRGYGIVTYAYTSTGPDNNATWRQSPYLAAYPRYDWHEISIWAWAASRVADFLETQDYVDKSRLILVGHSRIGKGAAWTGANDERFALVAAAGSSGGGIELSRLSGDGRGQGKEGISNMATGFSGQFGPHLADFVNGAGVAQVDRLPFDGHWLIALVAPRCFLSLEGTSDQYTDGPAVIASWRAAQPAFDLLGAGDNLGISFRPGGHLLAPADWKALLDFADWRLRGRNPTRRFDATPPPSELR